MPELVQKRREPGEGKIERKETDVEIDRLMDMLFRGSVYQNNRAAGELGKIGAPAVPKLIESLNDGDPSVRWRAAIALGAMGGPAVDPLIRVLESSSSVARMPATWAAAEIGDPKAVDPLVRVMTDDPSECCRVMAAAALLKLGDPRGVARANEVCQMSGADFTGQVLEAYWGT